MANLDNPTELRLGRVGIDSPLVRSTGTPQAQANSVVDSLLSIGKTIAGAAVKEQRRKEFYQGQDRVLRASLEGTQKEELQTIIEEQPWYMQVMGNGAVAEGAVEMASRVGAGRIFDENLARLANGQDADIDPDTYREQVMAQIGAQRTGNEQVDAVFMPQLITKGQSLIGAHLKKHFENNARNALAATVTESYDALSTLHKVVAGEQGPTATFKEGTPRELMTELQGQAYDAAVRAFSPEFRPPSVEEPGWIKGKLALALAAMERGDTAVYQILQDSGMFPRLSGEDRAAVDKARAKGKAENDSHNQLQFLGLEAQLTTSVFKAKTDSDILDVFKQARELAQEYDNRGVSRPDYLKDDSAIKAYVFKALGEKNSYDEKMENRRYAELEARRREAAELRRIQAEKSAAVAQADALNTALLVNALGNNPTAPVMLPNSDGQPVLYQPTKEERTTAYTQFKGALLQLPEDQRRAELAKRGLKSMEELAYRFQLVDENTKGQLTQFLRASLGKPQMDKYADFAIAKVNALAATGDFEYVKDHVQDDVLKKNLTLFHKAMKLTGDKDLAWAKSFGREQGVPGKLDEKRFKKEAASGDVKAAVKAAGRFGPQVQALLETEARGYILEGTAADVADGFAMALDTYAEHAEVTRTGLLMNVPRENQISARTGIVNPETRDNAIDFYLKGVLPKGAKYELTYSPGAGVHAVIPIDADGNHRFNAAFNLDYKAVQAVITDPNYKPPRQSSTYSEENRAQYR